MPPPCFTPSLATTHQLHAPLVRPETVTLQESPEPLLAENDWTAPLLFLRLTLTDFTPLLSVTVAENVALAPTVAPGPGIMLVMLGPVVSPDPPGAALGLTWLEASAAML